MKATKITFFTYIVFLRQYHILVDMFLEINYPWMRKPYLSLTPDISLMLFIKYVRTVSRVCISLPCLNKTPYNRNKVCIPG